MEYFTASKKHGFFIENLDDVSDFHVIDAENFEFMMILSSFDFSEFEMYAAKNTGCDASSSIKRYIQERS